MHSSCRIEPLKKFFCSPTQFCITSDSCMIQHLLYHWNCKQSNLRIYLIYTQYRGCYGCARLIYKDLITVMILPYIVISYFKRKTAPIDLYITLQKLLASNTKSPLTTLYSWFVVYKHSFLPRATIWWKSLLIFDIAKLTLI